MENRPSWIHQDTRYQDGGCVTQWLDFTDPDYNEQVAAQQDSLNDALSHTLRYDGPHVGHQRPPTPHPSFMTSSIDQPPTSDNWTNSSLPTYPLRFHKHATSNTESITPVDNGASKSAEPGPSKNSA
jgi:hypothetical protein